MKPSVILHTMQYYEVLVGAMAYHGNEALTYSWPESLPVGRVVQVTLRTKRVLGVVVRRVEQPGFTVKPITSTLPLPPLSSQSMELIEWLRGYYPAPLGAITRLFLPPTTAESRKEAKVAPAPIALVTDATDSLPALTSEQQQALETIVGPGSFLLHGITGSGKSRVYLELTKRAIQNRTSAILLTPEIGLTAQLAQTFRETFASQVYVLHSQQTAAERRDIWYGILKSDEPVVVIGPRSALFAPVHNLGLVVLDEAHDGAYKNESAPHYQAGRVAAKLAQLHGATYVSGSATPSVEDYYLAERKQRPVVAMNQLAKQSDSSVSIEMVDLKQSDDFGRSRVLSTKLIGCITAALQAGEQSLVFLNRRGTANVVLCSDCGWQTLCPNCDLTLTYHGDEHRLRCHVCGFTQNLPTACPVCHNTDILFKSIGTKAVEVEVQRLFPHAKIARFDTDLKKSERIEQNLYSLSQGGADILVGTQILGKGLDLPKLSVVGIINADSSLLIPDYTAAERTFQLIAQVAGRVGRGHRAGTVVVQTYNPDNETLRAALSKDWQKFYTDELSERNLYKFPPFAYMLQLRCLRASSSASEKAAADLKQAIEANYKGLGIEGPAPSFHPKEHGKYSWQLLIKSPQRQILVDIITQLPSGWLYDIDPINLL